MSSEESDTGSDERRILCRKTLPWLRKKYRKSLRKLDDLHYETLSTKSKHMIYVRVNSSDKSDRPHPQDIPKYLLVQDENSDTI